MEASPRAHSSPFLPAIASSPFICRPSPRAHSSPFLPARRKPRSRPTSPSPKMCAYSPCGRICTCVVPSSSTVPFPNGKSEVLLYVPRYDFNWQTRYVLRPTPLFACGHAPRVHGNLGQLEGQPEQPGSKPDRFVGSADRRRDDDRVLRVRGRQSALDSTLCPPPSNPPSAASCAARMSRTSTEGSTRFEPLSERPSSPCSHSCPKHHHHRSIDLWHGAASDSATSRPRDAQLDRW